MKKCSVAGCKNEFHARGFCHKHYLSNYWNHTKKAKNCSRKWRMAHRDEINKYFRKHNHLEKYKIWRHAYNKRPYVREKLRKIAIVWRKKNKEKIKQYQNSYRLSPKGKIFAKEYWAGVSKYRYRKFKKDYCERCGKNLNLCIHHLDKNRRNDSSINLVTLCNDCHRDVHANDPQNLFYPKLKPCDFCNARSGEFARELGKHICAECYGRMRE